MKAEINPFAHPDGSPKEGKEPEFFAWAKNWAERRLKNMSPEERDKAIKSQKALQRRMESWLFAAYIYVLMNKEDIIQKLDKNEPPTREEELFYLMAILGHTEEEAIRILEINDNKDPNIFLD